MIRTMHNETMHEDAIPSIKEDKTTYGKLSLNYKRNKKNDRTDEIDRCAQAFRYDDCKDRYWNPETHSLMWGTALWHQSDENQKRILNQLYWVAYYSQIISAEIATILLNQTSAAGLYLMEDFRLICDTLDLESSQERAHINAFKAVAEQTEESLFGERVFTYPMRTLFTETMIFQNTNRIKAFWKGIQLRAFALLSSGNAFIGSQYFLVRGIRTLCGKMVQEKLAHHYDRLDDKENAPIPSEISYHHYMDESYHFNSSTVISHDVIHSLKPPSAFERMVVNMGVFGCQKDHYNYSIAVNGLFWYDPALYQAMYKVLRSKIYNFNHKDAIAILRQSFTEESDGLTASHKTHDTAAASYEAYLDPLNFISDKNKKMNLMRSNTVSSYLKLNEREFARFEQRMAA